MEALKRRSNIRDCCIDGSNYPPSVHAGLGKARKSGANSCGDFGESAALVTLLKICTKSKDLNAGASVHGDILSRGLLVDDPFLASALVSMYAKCGVLNKAEQMFDGLPLRNVVIWSSLITGYAQGGHAKDALNCFERMQHEGVLPDAVTFACILKASGSISALDKGKTIHLEIDRQDLLRGNAILGGALVDMYARCGELAKAREVLLGLPARNVATWNALITAYVQAEHCDEALNCFKQMEHDGFSPDVVTFLCILKACSSIGELDKGQHVHTEIIRLGLLGQNVVLGNALVDMYVKCGALAKAKEVLEGLCVQDAVTWNALISGYAQSNYASEAPVCFEQMQYEGICPTEVTYTCNLKAYINIQAIEKGEHLHSKIVWQGLLQENVVLGNILVDMYAECGVLPKAKEVLDRLPIQSVVAWNALITGYVQEDCNEEALLCFKQMQHEGLLPDAVTFVSILKACGSTGALDLGENLHFQIIKQELLVGNDVLGSALVDMYLKCGAHAKATKVLSELPIQHVSAWNALISGFIQAENDQKALYWFEKMQCEGISPNAITFSCILKACGRLRALEKGITIHLEVIRQNLLLENVILSNALVDMYAKCGALSKAKEVLDDLLDRNAATWNVLISGCVQVEHGEKALYCFEQMQYEGFFPDAITFICCLKACGNIESLNKGQYLHSKIMRQGLLKHNIVLGNALVDMYAKCGALAKAKEALERLPAWDVVTWSILMTGYAQGDYAKEAFDCFEQLQCEGFLPDAFTFACILKACGSIGALDKGENLHGELAKQGLSGGDVVIVGALVDMYARCGAFVKAKVLLEGLTVKNVAVWNALIAGYVQGEYAKEAVGCFEQMQHEGISPNAVTFLCMLKACGSVGALDMGEVLHSKIVKQGLLEENVVLGNSLVDMYARCGSLGKAKEVLEGLPVRDVVTWNVLIIGNAQVDHGKEALECFERMQHEGLSPNEITFLCLLNVCSHSGLVDEGQKYFTNMRIDYGIAPDSQHLTWMINLFGCLGLLDKASAVVERLPACNYQPVWFGLLTACRNSGNLKLGRWAFKNFVQLDFKIGAS